MKIITANFVQEDFEDNEQITSLYKNREYQVITRLTLNGKLVGEILQVPNGCVITRRDSESGAYDHFYSDALTRLQTWAMSDMRTL